MLRALALLVPVFVLGAGTAAAQSSSTAAPPAPTRWVTDNAAFLTPNARAALDAKLQAYEQRTGHQVIVWIDRSLDGRPLDDFATRTFAAWQLGRKGKDDGLALFVFAEDRKIAIEVGYGLEGAVPDARASRIISDTMAPLLRAGENDRAVAAAVNEIISLIEGRPAAELGLPETPETTATPQPAHDPQLSLPEMILFGVLGVIILVLLVRNPQLLMLLFSGMFRGGGGGGSWRGGGGGGGGGFSGGGGRSGGGGARGGW